MDTLQKQNVRWSFQTWKVKFRLAYAAMPDRIVIVTFLGSNSYIEKHMRGVRSMVDSELQVTWNYMTLFHTGHY